MENFIKLIKAEIKNIKNVKHGIIDFKTHITGIYGQNGSGKTALVDSTNILKAYLLGRKLDFFIPSAFAVFFYSQSSFLFF